MLEPPQEEEEEEEEEEDELMPTNNGTLPFLMNIHRFDEVIYLMLLLIKTVHYFCL